ncbi:MAG TPA: hypothetical protein VG294_13475 [Solirubrobacteraceae bacterium]|jgi:hypothetical protein|nr:hypothetical protein [Solirubrobacteraceae bacterium]
MTRSRFRALYGASVGNLLVLVLSFAVAGLGVVGWFGRPRDVTTVIEWFVAAVVLHDLVAVPVYTLLDRIVFGSLRRADRRRTILGAVNATPYLRVPAILSGLLLVVFFPVIFGLGSQAELTASGIAEKGYLAKWLIASGVLFGLSGAVWGVSARRGPPAAPQRGPSVAPSEPAPEPEAPGGVSVAALAAEDGSTPGELDAPELPAPDDPAPPPAPGGMAPGEDARPPAAPDP